MSDKKSERVPRRIRETNALIRSARSKTMEWALAMDEMMNIIIAEYLADEEWKVKHLIYDILPLFSTSQRIQLLASLKTANGTAFANRRVMKQLISLNEYRNLWVHAIPSAVDRPELWLWRGKMNPRPINKRYSKQMENMCEKTYDTLAQLLQGLLVKRNRD